MPNVQIPLVGLSAEQKVACAIICCDQKKYDFATPRGEEHSCSRMGSRKHSCVTHTLRKRTDGRKLTIEDRFEDEVHIPKSTGQDIVIAKPTRVNGSIKKVKTEMTIVPDTLVKKKDGWHAIDAKFPCDPDKINAKIGTKGGQTKKNAKDIQYLSEDATGDSRGGFKEEHAYLLYEKDGETVKSSECMSPKDANDLQESDPSEGGGFECDCDDINDL